MVAFLFDTNILIDALAGHKGAQAEIERAFDPAISVITAFEVLAGVASWDKARVEKLLARFRQIDVDPDIVLYAAALARDRKLLLADAMIVATAQATNRILISRDAKLVTVEDDPPVRVPYTL